MRRLTTVLILITCTSFVYAQKEYKNLEKGFSIALMDECSIVEKDDKHIKINIPSMNGILTIFWPESREALDIQDDDFNHSMRVLKTANDKIVEIDGSNTMDNVQSERTIGNKVVIVSEFPGEKKSYFLFFSGQKNEHLDEVKNMIKSFKVLVQTKK